MYNTRWYILVFVSTVWVGSTSAVERPTTTTALADVALNPATLRVHFIDVGPGLAVLVETPHDRKHIFIDGGDTGLADMRTYVAHFVDADADAIAVAIVTHADQDHFLGQKSLFDQYGVGEFWYTGYESEILATRVRWNEFLQDVSNEPDVTIYSPISDWVSVGDTEVLDDGGTPDETSDDVVIRYLNVDKQPPEIDPIFGREFSESEQRNNASLVFKLLYGDVSFLITGDINGRDKSNAGEEHDNEIDSEELELWVRHTLMPDRYNLKATVLQAAHHGSNGSGTVRFIEAVAPEWIVVPAGHEHNHPHPDSLRRMTKAGVAAERILRTDDGDSTPEHAGLVDEPADDSYIFETDGQTITRLLRVKVEP